MSKNVCDVCGGDAIGVAASSLGALSYAYCARCLRRGYEPYDAIVGLVFCTDYHVIRGEGLLPCLAFHGKTVYDVRIDAQAIMDEYINDMNEEEEWDDDVGVCGRCGDLLFDGNSTLCSCVNDDFTIS